MTIASIDRIFTQGSLQTTGNQTDLAISGDGFFVVSDGDRKFYTRAGTFGLDKNGTLVNPGNGLKVQGWMATRNQNGRNGRQPQRLHRGPRHPDIRKSRRARNREHQV